MFGEDQANSEVPGGDEGQSAAADEAALASQNQAEGAVGEDGSAGEAEGTKPASDILVGNQKFASVEDLVKAHQELQKGFTQKTQQFSRELAAYKGVQKWLSDLRRDPARYERFLSMLREGVPMAQAAEASAKSQPTPQAAAQSDPLRERFEVMEREVAMEKASREADRFMQKHPELAEDEVRQVIERTIELQDEGRERSLEEVYRTEFFDMAAAKFYQKGERVAKDAQKKSAQGTSLGSVPPAGQAKPKEPRYADMKTEAAKQAWLQKKFASKGFKFETE